MIGRAMIGATEESPLRRRVGHVLAVLQGAGMSELRELSDGDVCIQPKLALQSGL